MDNHIKDSKKSPIYQFQLFITGEYFENFNIFTNDTTSVKAAKRYYGFCEQRFVLKFWSKRVLNNNFSSIFLQQLQNWQVGACQVIGILLTLGFSKCKFVHLIYFFPNLLDLKITIWQCKNLWESWPITKALGACFQIY